MLPTFRSCLVVAAACALSGCGTLYVAQAARGQMQILNAREPIARVIADPDTDAALRQRLEEVRLARAFASRELGLPDNKSYTSYADLKREFATWTVVATPEFSVKPREWCFPIVGCVSYRGYFRRRSAEKYAAKLEAAGMDVMVGGVPAYSTLGKFADPVLNTMMIYGDDELASIIFHELSHQVVYVPGDTPFNEAFAVAVEQEGLARWLAFRGRDGDLARYQKRRARQAESLALVARHRHELDELYHAPISPEEMRARKRAVFARLVAELRALAANYGTESPLAAELDGRPNNARLASLSTYSQCVPGFERLLEDVGRDLPAFYRRVRALAKLPREERHARLCGHRAAEQDGQRG
jgi:predicted aminopeptidase